MAKPKKHNNWGIESNVSQSIASESAYADSDRDRVAQRAYELYEARGGQHGRDMDDWLTAEREVSGRESSNGTVR